MTLTAESLARAIWEHQHHTPWNDLASSFRASLIGESDDIVTFPTDDELHEAIAFVICRYWDGLRPAHQRGLAQPDEVDYGMASEIVVKIREMFDVSLAVSEPAVPAGDPDHDPSGSGLVQRELPQDHPGGGRDS